MSGAAHDVQFLRVWPTKLVKRRLPDFEQPNDALVAMVIADEARKADSTARYQDENVFARTDPPVRWLAAHIEETVTGYLAHVGVSDRLRWKVEGWYNVNRLGDHHAPHGHPGAYLSGTYYARIPSGRDAEVGVHADAQPACISFHDPRSAANMVTLGTEPDAQPVHIESPRPGTLLMWPSQLQHYVHPNLSREHRVSVSFNIILEEWYGAPA